MCSLMPNNEGGGILKVLFPCLLVGGVFSAFMSFYRIEATDMGLVFNSLWQSIEEDELLFSGYHMLGPHRSLIVYPKKQLEVKFPSDMYQQLPVRTADGLQVDLQVAFQYQLLQSNEDLKTLVQLYYDWGDFDQYQKAPAMIARNVLRDLAARYEAYDFFYNRTMINQKMSDALGPKIREVAAKLIAFQLLSYTLPKEFDNALQDTELIRQKIKESGHDKADAQVKADQRLLRVKEEANIITNQKSAEAQKMANSLQQEKATFMAQINAEISSYKALQQSVNFTERNMLNYIWLQNVGSGAGGTTIRVAKPDDVRCFADPQACEVGPSLNGGPARALTYDCKVGEICAITVPGFSLSDKDALRVTSAVSCQEHTPPDWVTGAVPAVGSAYETKKGFRLGTPTETAETAYLVCYCAWQEQVLDCAVDDSFLLAGTLTITP
jgi:regulator of protease activity HflC (stomatin/prohibitin superfamily)